LLAQTFMVFMPVSASVLVLNVPLSMIATLVVAACVHYRAFMVVASRIT
jgi:hypothetical protein